MTANNLQILFTTLLLLINFGENTNIASADIKTQRTALSNLDSLDVQNHLKGTAGFTATSTDSSGCVSLDYCDAGTIQSINVNYSDGSSMKFCNCPDPVNPIGYLVGVMGNVPYKIRKHVKSLTSSSKSHAAPYASAGAGRLRTTLANVPTRVAIHEATHTLNRAFNYSTSQRWIDASNADTCVSDSYAKKTESENFSQTMVIYLYLQGINNLNDARFACMRKKLAFMETILSRSDISLK